LYCWCKFCTQKTVSLLDEQIIGLEANPMFKIFCKHFFPVFFVNPLKSELNPICHLVSLLGSHHILHVSSIRVNPLNAELIPTCHFLALLGAHHILHVSRIRVKPLNVELNLICHLLALLGAHRILHVSRIRVNYDLAITDDQIIALEANLILKLFCKRNFPTFVVNYGLSITCFPLFVLN
jgi:transposase